MCRRAGLLVVSVLLALVVSGCDGGDPEPEFSDEVSLSPSGSSSPTTSPSPSKTATPLTPVQTVRAWVKARNVTVQTGDTTEVYALSAADCDTCRDSVEPVADVHDSGGRYDTHGWRVVKAVKDLDFRSNRSVIAALIYTAGRTWPSEGAEPVEYGVEKRLAMFELVREGDRWLIDALIYVD